MQSAPIGPGFTLVICGFLLRKGYDGGILMANNEVLIAWVQNRPLAPPDQGARKAGRKGNIRLQPAAVPPERHRNGAIGMRH